MNIQNVPSATKRIPKNRPRHEPCMQSLGEIRALGTNSLRIMNELSDVIHIQFFEIEILKIFSDIINMKGANVVKKSQQSLQNLY